MSSPIEQNRERVSALMDGQLHSQEFADAVHAACDDADAQESWGTYHLIGDVLRGDPAAQRHASSDFVARLQVRLLAERIALAPVADVVAEPGGALHAPSRQSAANNGSFRWKMVAGFASLAAVAAVGWNSVSTVSSPAAAPQLVQGVASPLVAVANPTSGAVMLRDPQLDEILAAHKQQGGSSALQMPAGFLRNATFEGHTR
jgi:sigma-E factor negative regulatory protein RseA